MNANINIKITYDDLSESCKEKIKKFEKEFGCTIQLIYPELTSYPNTSIGVGYPYTYSINDLVLRTPPCSEVDDLVLRTPQPRDKDGNPQVVLCGGKSFSSSGKSSSSSGKTCYYDCN